MSCDRDRLEFCLLHKLSAWYDILPHAKDFAGPAQSSQVGQFINQRGNYDQIRMRPVTILRKFEMLRRIVAGGYLAGNSCPPTNILGISVIKRPLAIRGGQITYI